MNYLQSDKRRAETAKSPTGLSQRDRTTDKRPEIIFRGKKQIETEPSRIEGLKKA